MAQDLLIQALKQYWGFDRFRYPQKDIIESVIEGKDVLALLPTGGGKSLCYQLPSVLHDGLTVVVSPLIALMRDQVDSLNRKGIWAGALYTGMYGKEFKQTLENASDGTFKLLYVSPERLESDEFKDWARYADVKLLVVDEAHCVSQWGHMFRPSYLSIADWRNKFAKKAPLLALTGTATPKVEADILEQLQLKNPEIFKVSLVRKQLALVNLKAENKLAKTLRILTRIPGSAIVYTGTRKTAEEVHKKLNEQGIISVLFHAGIAPKNRNIAQNEWVRGLKRVIVATNAFGMGIDKPDVRVVIHWDPPMNPENWYQECGRAGRDGKRAYAVTLFNGADFKRLEQWLKSLQPEPKVIRQVYNALASFLSVAVGQQVEKGLKFDLTKFSTHFKIAPSLAYRVIQILEKEGLIAYEEATNRPSRIMFTGENLDIYQFQVKNLEADSFVRYLLRTHGGNLFTRYVKLRLEPIAAILKQPPADLDRILKKMTIEGIASYEPGHDWPMLSFNGFRYSADDLPLNEKRLLNYFKGEQERLWAVERLCQRTDVCRMQSLLEWFEEDLPDPCGICDVCLDKKKGIENKTSDLASKILELVETPRFIQEICNTIEGFKEPQIQMTLRDLLETGKVGYDNRGRIILSKN